MDNKVGVFVRCEPNQTKQVLTAITALGFTLKLRSIVVPMLIGYIDQSKIPELEKIPGVVNVIQDFTHNPFKP